MRQRPHDRHHPSTSTLTDRGRTSSCSKQRGARARQSAETARHVIDRELESVATDRIGHQQRDSHWLSINLARQAIVALFEIREDSREQVMKIDV